MSFMVFMSNSYELQLLNQLRSIGSIFLHVLQTAVISLFQAVDLSSITNLLVS